MSSSRPEASGPPEYYYDADEAVKYTDNSRIIKIQTEMAERALELLALPVGSSPAMILDLGCGSGLSGSVLEQHGHFWVGMDISQHMLSVASARSETTSGMDIDSNSDTDDCSSEEDVTDYDDDEEQEEQGSEEYDYNDSIGGMTEQRQSTGFNLGLLQGDLGDGVCFRPGTFDGCISISALQWLCYSNRSSENPKTRLTRLFVTLFASLSRGARAVFQLYPENQHQIDLILSCAMKAGFTGGMVIDYPNSTKAKKYYLCLMTSNVGGSQQQQQLPQARMSEDQSTISVASVIGRHRFSSKKQIRRQRANETHRDWVHRKKQRARGQGQDVAHDSKYTARKRRRRGF